MFDINSIRKDKSRSESGVEVDCGGGLFLTVAWNRNPRAQAVRQQLIAKNPILKRAVREDGFHKVDPKLLEELNVEVQASTILLGWRGLSDGGKEVPYSVEKAKEYLRDVEEFRDLVTRLSQDDELFKQDSTAANAENLKKTSSGASSGATK